MMTRLKGLLQSIARTILGHRSLCLLLLMGVTLVSLSGCATYSYPRVPSDAARSEYGVLEKPSSWTMKTTIVSVDGRNFKTRLANRLKLAPGWHVVSISWSGRRHYGSEYLLGFDVEAGHLYKFEINRYEDEDGDVRWHPRIWNDLTGETVSAPCSDPY